MLNEATRRACPEEDPQSDGASWPDAADDPPGVLHGGHGRWCLALASDESTVNPPASPAAEAMPTGARGGLAARDAADDSRVGMAPSGGQGPTARRHSLGAHILEDHGVYRRRKMTKRLIELDDSLLADAQRALRTGGVSDTVRAALRQVTDAEARLRQAQWLRDGGLEEMADPEARAAVWR